MNNYIKFSPNSDVKVEQIKTTKAGQLREKLDNGEKLTREEKNWITERCSENIHGSHTAIPILGWFVSFKDVFKRYIVKSDDCWFETYGFDKTSVKKTFNRVDEIYEIPNKIN